MPGHNELGQTIVAVRGVRVHGEVTTLYALQLSASKFVTHFAGKQRFPNAAWTFQCNVGLDGSTLRLVCRTPNGVGIAPGQPFFVDAGLSFTESKAKALSSSSPTSTSPFKGMLDHMWKQASEVEGATPDKAGVKRKNPETPATTPEDSAKQVRTEDGKVDPKPCNPSPPPNPEKPVGVEEADKKQPAEKQSKHDLGKQIAKLTVPFPFEVFCKEQESGPTLHLESGDLANKRLPKDTLLKMWTAGDFASVPKGGAIPTNAVLYDLQASTKVYSNDLSTPLSLSELVKKKGRFVPSLGRL